MNALAARFLEQLLLPPGGILTGLLIAMILLSTGSPRRLRHARRVLFVLFCLTYAASLQVTAQLVSSLVEPADQFPTATLASLRQAAAQAIVIFGCGRIPKAPEYDHQDTLSHSSLARVRYGARLHRLTKLPLLLAGGRPYGEEISEARLMRDVLENEFHTPVKWLDEESRNTWENAVNASVILKAENIRRVLLVVHARDAARALWSLRKAGGDALEIVVTPILPRVTSVSDLTPEAALLRWIPNPDAMSSLTVALHEWVGAYWYRLIH